MNQLDLSKIVANHVAALPIGQLLKSIPEPVNTSQTRAGLVGATAEQSIILRAIAGFGNAGAPGPPGGPSDNDDDDDDRRRRRSRSRRGRKDRGRKSRSRSRERRSRSRGRHRKRRGSDSDWDDSSDSDSDRSRHDDRQDRGRRRSDKRSNGKLEVIRPLNDLFTVAVNYKTYRLGNRSQRYDTDVARGIGKIQKRLDVQMKSHNFSGDEPISVLGFSERFKGACDHNDVSEGAALWCLRFYLTGPARSILKSRLGTSLMAVDVDRTEMLSAYKEAVNYLLRTYATDEVIAEAYTETVSYRQSSGMTESDYSRKLWEKALRCGSLFSDRRMKSMFAEGLLPTTRAQVRNYLASHPDVDYQSVTRYAEDLGETYRSGKRCGAKPNPKPTDGRGEKHKS